MQVRFGSQTFLNVKIPVLWGTRAVIGHASGELSIVDLSDTTARPEVVANVPWAGVEYSESEDGFVIFKNGASAYFYSPARKLLRDLSGSLPEIQLFDDKTRIGTNTVSGSLVSGYQVGIGISEDGFFVGGPMPAGLADLIV